MSLLHGKASLQISRKYDRQQNQGWDKLELLKRFKKIVCRSAALVNRGFSLRFHYSNRLKAAFLLTIERGRHSHRRCNAVGLAARPAEGVSDIWHALNLKAETDSFGNKVSLSCGICGKIASS
jgi:hypothetical protein